MNNSLWIRGALVGLAFGLLGLAGCPGPISEDEDGGKIKGGAGAVAGAQEGEKQDERSGAEKTAKGLVSEAKAEDVAAAKKLLDALGSNASYKIVPNGVMTELAIQDGASMTVENIALIGRLADLESLGIFNYRALDDEMVTQLSGLKKLKSLTLTNSVIGDPSVDAIAESFPELTSLDLSYNANLTNGVMKVICQLSKLERLTLIQTRFNDIGTMNLEKLANLKVLDIRGNMEAGEMTLETVGLLPKIAVLKHRSTTVGDYGIEALAESKTLKSLLVQDFGISSRAGELFAQISSLTELEIFRCQGFGSDGVLALKDLPLTRLKLRDLPEVDDVGMAAFDGLSELQRLYLHEIDSVTDEGLKSLGNLKSLQVLDIWVVPQMTDSSVEVIAALPNLKELSIRGTGVTDAAVDSLLAMPSLRKLTFKENAGVTAAGLKKLTSKEWETLDTGQ